MHRVSPGPQASGAEGQSCLTEAPAPFWALPLGNTGVRYDKKMHSSNSHHQTLLIKYISVFFSFLPPWTCPALHCCVHFLPLICRIKLSKCVPVTQQPGKSSLNYWWFQTPQVSGCVCKALELSILVLTSQKSKKTLSSDWKSRGEIGNEQLRAGTGSFLRGVYFCVSRSTRSTFLLSLVGAVSSWAVLQQHFPPASPALLKPSFPNAVDLTELSLPTPGLALACGWVHKPQVVTVSWVSHCAAGLACSRAAHTQEALAAINPFITTAAANGLLIHTSTWCKSRILKAQACCWRE